MEISILIPAYNAGQHIYRSIEGCIKQSFSDFEIIVIDDASTDNTRDIVNKINDDRIRLISLQKNCGPACARNIGLKLARGRFVAILDADDFWHPERLAILHRFADRLGEKAVLFDEIQEVLEDRSGKLRNRIFSHSNSFLRASNEEILEIQADEWIMESPGAQPFFNRQLVVNNKIYYPEGINFGEDFFFLVKLIALHGVRLYKVCKPLYFRLIRQGSLTASPRRLEYQEQVYDQLLIDNSLNKNIRDAIEYRKEKLADEKHYQKFKILISEHNWMELVNFLMKNPQIIWRFISGIPVSLPYRLSAIMFGSKIR